MPATRRFRLLAAPMYSLDRPAAGMDDLGNSWSYVTIGLPSLQAVNQTLQEVEFDIAATDEASLYDELSDKAKALFGASLPTGITDLIVNDSRPTAIPNFWNRTPGAYWLHAITGVANGVTQLAIANAKKSTSRDVWCLSCVMAYPL